MAGAAGETPRMWCPRHDRTYARRATCPRCKTPLIRIDPPSGRRERPSVLAPVEPELVAVAPSVAEPDPLPDASVVVEPEREEPPEEDKAPPRRADRFRVPLSIAAAVALAFALGVALPDQAGTPEPGPSPGAAVEVEARPYTIAAIAGVAMRLERVSQMGERVEVLVRVLRGFEASSLREAFIDLVLEDGSHVEIDDPSIRAGRTRFSATFLLPSAESRIKQMRIIGLRTSAGDDPIRLVTSIEGSWPVPRDEQPRVVPAGAVSSTESARVRWVSTILWTDRVEVVLDMSDYLRGVKRTFGYAELFESDGVSEALAAGFVGAREEGTRLHLDFAGLREDASRLVLFLGQPTTVLDGPWTWSLNAARFRTSGVTGAMDRCAEDLTPRRHPCS